jgi:hypothetical protein
MIVLKEALPLQLFNSLKEGLLSRGTPWLYDSQTSDYSGFNSLDFHYVHPIFNIVEGPVSLLYEKSIKCLDHILSSNNLERTELFRIKSNSLTIVDPNTSIESPSHIDIEDPEYITVLLYLNNSEGDTKLYPSNEEDDIVFSTPEENKALIFRSSQTHSGSHPVHTKRRVVLNYVLKAQTIGTEIPFKL